MLESLKIDCESPVPVYRQIAGAILDQADAGGMAAGHRLPATRDLARSLGVNRNTVVAAYDLLIRDGRARSHTGRGTFLVDPPVAEKHDDNWYGGFSQAVTGAATAGLQSIYRLAISTEGISFVGSYPADELIPVRAFERAMQKALGARGVRNLSYGPTAGQPELREAIAGRMRRDGSDVGADDVLVTNGAQQALQLVFRTFLDRGDPIAIEEPTYTGALSALESIGARPLGVPVDERGIRPDLLEVVLERQRPKLLYLQPTFHNPTTCEMDTERRQQVLELARRYRCTIVEDDWGGELRFKGQRLATLHAMDGGAHVIYVSTFSKNLMPGLRLGWLTAPTPVLRRLIELKRVQDCGTSPILQAALHAFLEEGELERHLEQTLPRYLARRDAMLTALEQSFPEGAHWTRPRGGLFIWVTLPQAIDGNDLFVTARQRGVLYSRGELFHSDGSGRHQLRLTYSAATTDEIARGVATLGQLVRERWPKDNDSRTDGETGSVEAVPIF
ncbi:MAG: PLP-dependent aminotransferase family protein [Acidobacteriota bacterium]|nr:PLP-dependent aminotransferase family protein [Acidobacteriota bacterium]MDH3784091.1 PLP-dependent aminotransferase family protein [Acidobacteriota bacterium]